MEFKLLVDYHTHTGFSPDSDADMLEICNAAEKAGILQLAITDHVEIPAFIQDGYDKTIDESYKQAGEMQAAFRGRIEVLKGIELGEPIHDLNTAEQLLKNYDFDFVLGSLHNLKDDRDFYHYDFTSVDIRSLMDRYFAEQLEMVKWGKFNSLAHLTYPFRYIPKGRYPEDYGYWRDVIDEILRLLAVKGIALEINTSGLRQALGKTMPDEFLIRRFRELGGEMVTVGSDAHKPCDVGKNIRDGINIAYSAGFRYIATFKNGHPKMVPIL
ncbi:MAG TPA: histidinol-phosphatase HisJ family protein [Clostridiales bacterium]|nr:histidinol-phosphatase HisJ family protein [Clostridiales bacterium]